MTVITITLIQRYLEDAAIELGHFPSAWRISAKNTVLCAGLLRP